MVDAIRRVLAIAMLALAVAGLLPLIPLAFGYTRATVQNGVTFPEAVSRSALTLVSCYQDPAQLPLTKGSPNSGSLRIQCTNNWTSPVDVAVTLTNANGSSMAISPSPVTFSQIPAGATQCQTVTYSGAKTNGKGGADVVTAVLYSATGTAANARLATQFTAELVFSNSHTKDPSYVCP